MLKNIQYLYDKVYLEKVQFPKDTLAKKSNFQKKLHVHVINWQGSRTLVVGGLT